MLDPTKCTQCGACEVACVTVRYPELAARGTPGPGPVALQPDDAVVLERRRLVIRAPDGDVFGDRPALPTLDVCVHCPDSPCVTVCPHNALVRFRDGRVELIEPRCTGCGACISACPYRAIRRVTALSIAVKCDNCAPMDRPGHVVPIEGGPACVKVCPTGALSMG